MAIDSNGLKLLFWAKSLGASFERTITLGRQGVLFGPGDLRRESKRCGVDIGERDFAACFEREPMGRLYAEGFFSALRCRELTSADYSPFEGANLIHDLNHAFPVSLESSYDMVFDGGTLEHIFNYPAALTNCMRLVRPGGHFVSIAPANSLMGHGFYQISPELFFRVFAPENGFRIVKVVLFAASSKNARFYEVTDPVDHGYRVELAGSTPMFLGVIAQRTDLVDPLTKPPHQSDYVAGWKAHSDKVKTEAQRSGWLWNLRVKLSTRWPFWLRTLRSRIRSIGQRSPNRISNRAIYRPVLTEDFKGTSVRQHKPID